MSGWLHDPDKQAKMAGGENTWEGHHCRVLWRNALLTRRGSSDLGRRDFRVNRPVLGALGNGYACTPRWGGGRTSLLST
jgi:hypothetical protein